MIVGTRVIVTATVVVTTDTNLATATVLTTVTTVMETVVPHHHPHQHPSIGTSWELVKHLFVPKLMVFGHFLEIASLDFANFAY